ncbi:MAG: hypothetical protein IJJ33_13495 [Victivallales bacterium]|nr:hypothetical protein [Victivallales bacterium]
MKINCFVCTTLLTLAGSLWASGNMLPRLTPTDEELKAAAIPELAAPLDIRALDGNRLAVKAVLRDGRTLSAEFKVPIEGVFEVKDEEFPTLQLFRKGAPQWSRQSLKDVSPRLVVPGSIAVADAPGGKGRLYRAGIDFWVDEFLGRLARLEGGELDERPVFVSWRGRMQRLDSVALVAGKRLEYRRGVASRMMPVPPPLGKDEVRLANVFLPCGTTDVSEDNFYPITERFYPIRPNPTAEQLLPRTMARLRSGEPLRILAWGDSITNGTYFQGYKGNRWQEKAVAGLQKRFPKARIELRTLGWGGRGIADFLKAPSGHKFNYQEQVLDKRPDLVIMEFHNDYARQAEDVSRDYEKVLVDFQASGIEWLPMTPPFTAGNLGLSFPAKAQKNIQETSWPLVTMLREFAGQHELPLAEAHERYVRIWRQGIPRLTLFTNHYNHPAAEGMQLLADAVLDVFPQQ